MDFSVRLLCLLLLLGSAGAMAEEQGRLGSDSTARFTISLAIQPLIEITTVSDVTVNITDRTVDAHFTKPFCVNGSVGGKYTVIASGSQERGETFILQNTDGETLPYLATYRGEPLRDGFDPLVPSSPSRVYDVLPRGKVCTDVTAFKITFRAADLQLAGAGLYSGSLTLLVSPV